MRKFSRRTQDQLNEWAMRYCDAPEVVVEKMKKNDLGRYFAINLTNIHTIEFRLFRGTLRLDTFFSTLQFVNTLVNKVKSIQSNEELQQVRWEDLLSTDDLKKYWERVKDR